MNTDLIKGIIPPILTPITEDELIDEKKLREHVNFIIDGGVSGILAFGSNGEFYMVDEVEQKRGLKIMVDEAAGRVPVYFGIGAIKTSTCIRFAKMAVECGAFGISVLQPMFLKPTEEELYKHFEAIAKSVPDTPVLLYNNPVRTGYTLSSNLVLRLAENVSNIVGMKDTSGDMTQGAEFIRKTRHLGFKFLGGKDTLIFSSLVHGGCGAVASTANFAPELVCSIYNTFISGDTAGSLEAQYELNPIRLVMDKASFPVATKDMANLIGRNIGKPFEPNLPSSVGVLDQIRQEMEKAGLIL